MSFQRIDFGQRIKPFGIQQVSVNDGQKLRLVLIDPRPAVKAVVYCESIKKTVQVTQESMNAPEFAGLTPKNVFYYLVAKLDTDNQGNILSDLFEIQYLKLASYLNEKFLDACQELPNFTSIAVTKEKKGEFSHINCLPSSMRLPDALYAKIEKVKEVPDLLDKSWSMIDAATSISYQDMKKLLADVSTPVVDAIPAPAPTAQISAPEPQAPAPAPEPQAPAPAPVQEVQATVVESQDFNLPF